METQPTPQLIQNDAVEYDLPTAEQLTANIRTGISNTHLTWREAIHFHQQRDRARLQMCLEVAELLREIEAAQKAGVNYDPWAVFALDCKEQGARGDLPETRCVDLVTRDPEASWGQQGHVSDERRSIYGGVAMWFWKCATSDPDDHKAMLDEASAIEGGLKGLVDAYKKSIKQPEPPPSPPEPPIYEYYPDDADYDDNREWPWNWWIGRGSGSFVKGYAHTEREGYAALFAYIKQPLPDNPDAALRYLLKAYPGADCQQLDLTSAYFDWENAATELGFEEIPVEDYERDETEYWGWRIGDDKDDGFETQFDAYHALFGFLFNKDAPENLTEAKRILNETGKDWAVEIDTDEDKGEQTPPTPTPTPTSTPTSTPTPTPTPTPPAKEIDARILAAEKRAVKAEQQLAALQVEMQKRDAADTNERNRIYELEAEIKRLTAIIVAAGLALTPSM